MSKPPFIRLPSTACAYRLSTVRGEFAVHDAGEPRIGTALLVPGFTGSKEDFTPLLRPLTDRGFRVVAVDGRGQYETGGPRSEEAYAQPELARDVLALTEALRHGEGGDAGAGGREVDRPTPARVHLLGHSLGGLIARAAVLLDATPFASLTLMSSGPSGVSADQRRRLELLLGALPVMAMEEIWHTLRDLDPVEAADEQTPPAVAEFLHRRWIAQVPELLTASARQLMGEPDRVEELAEAASASRADSAEAPLRVHVLSGSVDFAWPVPVLDEMAVRLRAVRTVVAGTGHSPNVEGPEETARALADFWGGSGGGAGG